MTCPICGKEQDNKLAYMESMRLIYDNGGLVSNHVNPGGRELVLANGTRVRLSDQCYHCDGVAIKKAFEGVQTKQEGLKRKLPRKNDPVNPFTFF